MRNRPKLVEQHAPEDCVVWVWHVDYIKHDILCALLSFILELDGEFESSNGNDRLASEPKERNSWRLEAGARDAHFFQCGGEQDVG